MKVFIDVESMVEGDYLNARVSLPVTGKLASGCRGGFKILQISWVKGENRCVKNVALEWVRKNRPEVEAEFSEYAKWICSNVSIKGKQ